MKKYLNKTIGLFIAIILLSFSCVFFKVHATPVENIQNTQEDTQTEEEQKETNSFVNILTEGVLYLGQLLEDALSEVLSSGFGKVNPSIDSIIFNQYPITRIDYFRNDVKINDEYNNLGIQLKEAVSFAYSIEVATIISIFIFFLVYIGIKIIAVSIADEKAKYKESLISWLIGLFMLLSFHFIMGCIIEVNDSMVNFARGIVENGTKTGTMVLQDLVNRFKEPAYLDGNIVKAIIWLALLLKTLSILFKYLKRLITITILMLLFPFVTLGYVFDKLKGGKSKIFDIWLTAFLQNVFINFIDAIVYLILVQVVLDATMSTLLIPVIAIMIFDNISDEIAKIIGINKNVYLSPVNATSIISQNNKGIINDLKENISNLNKKEEKDKDNLEINAINSLGRYDSKKNSLIITKEKENNAANKMANTVKTSSEDKSKVEKRSVNIEVEEVLNEKNHINIDKSINQNLDNILNKDIKNNVKDTNAQGIPQKTNTDSLKNAPLNTTPKIELGDVLPKIKVNTDVKVNAVADELRLLDALRYSSIESFNEEKNEEKELNYEKDENEKYSIDNILRKAGINPEKLTQEEKLEIYKNQISTFNDIKKEAKVEMKKKQKFNKKS